MKRTLPKLAAAALAAGLTTKISYTLPEGRDIRLNAQGLVPDSDDETNIRFAEDADVRVTFLSEGAGYRNSVGDLTYDPASPPGASGIYQNTIKLGRFTADPTLSR